MSEVTLQKLLEDLIKSGKDSVVKIIEWNKKIYRVRTMKIENEFVIRVMKL